MTATVASFNDEIAALYRMVADAFDDLIGVRNNPERLLTIANVIFMALFVSSLLILAKLPDDVAPTIFDHKLPNQDAHYKISVTPSGIIHNVNILAQSRKTVKMLFSGFIMLVLMLIFLVNVIGSAAIKVWRAEQAKETKKID